MQQPPGVRKGSCMVHMEPKELWYAAESLVALPSHCQYCFDVLSAHFSCSPMPRMPFPGHIACPMFVTWNKLVPTEQAGVKCVLRGCIGCLNQLPLSALCDYALISALHDQRFPPVGLEELPSLQCTVQLLGHFEMCATHDWELGVHGISLSFIDHAGRGAKRNAVYLPDVISGQGWSKSETIDSLIRKSGFDQPITDAVRTSLRVYRFISTRCSLPYEQWILRKARG